MCRKLVGTCGAAGGGSPICVALRGFGLNVVHLQVVMSGGVGNMLHVCACTYPALHTVQRLHAKELGSVLC